MKKLKISIFYPVVIVLFLVTSLLLVKYRTDHIKYVAVYDDTKDYYLQTYAKTVDEVLKDCEIDLSPYDQVTPALGTILDQKTDIIINRSFSLTVYDGKEAIEVNTTNHTVRGILDELSLSLNTNDIVQPFVDAKISAGTNITITRVMDVYEKKSYQIPYLTEINLVYDLEDTETKVVQEGEAGIKEVNYRLRYENDELVSRNIVSEVVVKDPINEIKNKGTNDLFVTSRGIPFRYSKVLIVQATAYDLSYASCGKYPGEPGYGITYSGTRARPGVIAVDPRVIPLGSNVYVESLDSTSDYGFAVAEDTGSAIKGNRVDLFIGSNRAALRYGRRNVRIYILDDKVDNEFIKGYGY